MVALSKLTPYQQLEAQKSYVGVAVSWTVTFRSLTRMSFRDESTYLVLTNYGKEDWGASVIFDADINRFPRLKIAKPGDQLQVMGMIDGINYAVNLKDVSIEFL